MCVQTVRQDTGDILKQATAGDMRHRVDFARADHRQQRFYVDAGRRHECVDKDDILVENGRTIEFPALVCGKPPNQRETVGMHA